MIYNYRFDRDLLTQILQRLRAEQVRSQGWGGGNEANLNVANADFVTRCTSYYKRATTRVPSNLTRMRDLKRGDLLVVPHLPEYGKVSIHVVADDFPACYEYVSSDDSHQNHGSKIQRSYGLDGLPVVVGGDHGRPRYLRRLEQTAPKATILSTGTN